MFNIFWCSEKLRLYSSLARFRVEQSFRVMHEFHFDKKVVFAQNLHPPLPTSKSPPRVYYRKLTSPAGERFSCIWSYFLRFSKLKLSWNFQEKTWTVMIIQCGIWSKDRSVIEWIQEMRLIRGEEKEEGKKGNTRRRRRGEGERG